MQFPFCRHHFVTSRCFRIFYSKSFVFSDSGIGLQLLIKDKTPLSLLKMVGKLDMDWKWLLFYFIYRFFFSQTIHKTAERGRRSSFFFCYTSSHSWTFRHLFATLHVRWLIRIFNCTACNCHTATQWDLPPCWANVWLIDDGILVSLFTWRFDSRFFYHNTLTRETDEFFELASTDHD